MAVAASDIDAAIELFSGLGRITARKMMGGATFYADGQIFGILSSEGQLYLRSKGPLAARLLEMGCKPFEWQDPKTGKVKGMGYVTLPDAAVDDPDMAVTLARQALAEG